MKKVELDLENKDNDVIDSSCPNEIIERF